MSFNQQTATDRAKQDLAERLNFDKKKIDTISINEQDFPNMSLGAPVSEEMSAQMISYGWKITLGVDRKKYEYRADKYQLRLVDYKGSNHIVVS